MIVIKDTVSIKTTASDVFHWFEHLGNLPFFGRFIDIILNLLFSNIINDLRQHMSEEGANLRFLLERQKSENKNILSNTNQA